MPKAKQKLTNIRPREVSVVDNPANQKDFLVVKNKNGKTTEIDQEITKKIEVSFHTLNFFKSMFPTKESCFEFLKTQGIDAEGMKVIDMEHEYRVVVKDSAKFEGHSLAGSYFMPVNVGVDGLVGILKSLTNNQEQEVEKIGAKLSAKRLGRLKEMKKELDALIAEVDKELEIAKNIQPEGEPSTEPVKPEGEPSTEPVKPEGEVKPDGQTKQDENIAKSLEIQSKQLELLKAQGKTIEAQGKIIKSLEQKVNKMMDAPDDPQGGEVDQTTEVTKNNEKSLFSGIL